ncbi:hypothetical protein H072_2433 [Dactylellina haptotyla CBS 200.50]|uniref:Uncharacterized protein n=1 Tax=Dactylellina haptotyla (strain CBS 200.50) TaxID=1284197 RepID=S8BVV5_DACHA|nr:hypothetical protein H072_2433 [Dactylellina haptotyla CBS 200.50]
MANVIYNQEIPSDSSWPTDDPLTYVESLLQNDANTELGMLQSDPMDTILSFDNPDWLTTALAEISTSEPPGSSPTFNHIVEIEEVEANNQFESPNTGGGDNKPSHNFRPNLLETDTTPLAEASQPLVIPRQPAVMQPITSQPGRKRKNATPSGIMVFSLPGRQSKRRKMTEQERQSRAQKLMKG